MKNRILLSFVGGVITAMVQAQQINPAPPTKTGIHTRVATETLDVAGTVRVAVSTGKIYNGNATRSTDFVPYYDVVANADGVLGVIPRINNIIFPKLYLPIVEEYRPFYTPTNAAEVEERIYTYFKGDSFFMRLSAYADGQLRYAPWNRNPYWGSPGLVQNPNTAANTLGFSEAIDFYRDKMDFYVTYYDTDVYTDVKIIVLADGAQELTYKVKPDAKPTSKTYMNILMKPR